MLNADIKDMGLDLFETYAATMNAVGRGKTENLAAASQAASDSVVDFKRRAVGEFMRFYREELVPQARELAKAEGRDDLLPIIEQETEPLVLLGGDEITVSLHGLFAELKIVKLAVAKLTDRQVANARVAVTHSGAGDPATGHVGAMKRAQAGHDQLKDTFEPYARELVAKAKKIPEPLAAEARSLAGRISRMYTLEVVGTTKIIDAEGKVVDRDALEAEVKRLLTAMEAQ